jgi:hypothetical protein
MARIRSYLEGDEGALVALANRAYAHYAGSVPRTVEHWRWSILSRPGVAAADVLLLVAGEGGLLGYGVLGPGGIVLEFCLEPELTGDRRTAAARALTDALEARCLATGVESILFELPRSDARVRALLTAGGYRHEESRSLELILVDVAAALTHLLAHRRGRMPHDWRPIFLLALAPGHYRAAGSLVLRIAPGESIPVSRAENDTPADVRVETDLSTLTDLIFRRTRFDEARGAGRIAIEPAAREQDARTLCEWLVLKSMWYTPPADDRGSCNCEAGGREAGGCEDDGPETGGREAPVPPPAVRLTAYQAGDETALVHLLNGCRGGAWGDETFWRWKHGGRPGFRPADVVVARSAGAIVGCLHSAVLDLKIEEGLTVPMSFDGDCAVLSGAHGDDIAACAHDLSGAEFRARGVVFRGGFTSREQNERFSHRRFGHVLVPGVTTQFRKYLGPGALAPRVAELGARLLARPAFRRALRRPFAVDLAIDGFPPCHAVLAADGFRLERGRAPGADLRARLTYLLLTEFADREFPRPGVVFHAVGRGELAVAGLLRAAPRLVALAVAYLRR